MRVPLAIVHHANQYLITDGYDNKEGLSEVTGSAEGRTGLARVLELHRIYGIPANIQVSGTLIEALAWHRPEFLAWFRGLIQTGLFEIVGSCYGQNVMPFFDDDHNTRQIEEQLLLYELHLGVKPSGIRSFWPAERVWDTETMAPVLRNRKLPNGGYRYVVLDDRLLLRSGDTDSPRRSYDANPSFRPELFQPASISNAMGLVSIPIAGVLRCSIPPGSDAHWEAIESLMASLKEARTATPNLDLIAVYGDDMEKVAGVGPWNKFGPKRFESFLKWIAEREWIEPVRIQEWTSGIGRKPSRQIDRGTYVELANHFGAGEDYRKWYGHSSWTPYRRQFEWSEKRVSDLAKAGADSRLIELAHKHLLASAWETAWHTPPEGPYHSSKGLGKPSPWICAIASHSRHAAVIAEAAFWMTHKDDDAHIEVTDIDGDGDDEIILKNNKLFAVISPKHGGRMTCLFSIAGREGRMVIGNPADDWNWMESLNAYMHTPPIHPGAFADLACVDDLYSIDVTNEDPASVAVELRNQSREHSGLTKEFILRSHSNEIEAHYSLPDELRGLTVEFGISPDYLDLLRVGRNGARTSRTGRRYTLSCGRVQVWVSVESALECSWLNVKGRERAHVFPVRLATSGKRFVVRIGAEEKIPAGAALDRHAKPKIAGSHSPPSAAARTA